MVSFERPMKGLSFLLGPILWGAYLCWPSVRAIEDRSLATLLFACLIVVEWGFRAGEWFAFRPRGKWMFRRIT